MCATRVAIEPPIICPMKSNAFDHGPGIPAFGTRLALLTPVLGGVVLAAIRFGSAHQPARMARGLDRIEAGVVLWAWERPENLSFADPARVAVAFLSGTVRLRGEEVLVRPRFQPLRVAPGSRVIPVVRVEVDKQVPPSLTAAQVSRVSAAIAGLVDRNEPGTVQVDFDASTSQRAFYRLLLGDLRRRLPRGRKISITALASWCDLDRWLDGLPIDEAVPMLFRMGPDGPSVVRRLRRARSFADPRCRGSVGLSVDEAAGWEHRAPRTYAFNPRPWTEDAVNSVLRARGGSE